MNQGDNDVRPLAKALASVAQKDYKAALKRSDLRGLDRRRLRWIC